MHSPSNRFLITCTLWVVGVLSWCVIGLVTVLPAVTHTTPMAVLSGSMAPTFNTGSMVYVEHVDDPSSLTPGQDVVTVYRGDRDDHLTHRLVSVDPVAKTITTKGDANAVPDEPFPFDHVVGKVKYSIPELGRTTLSGLWPYAVVANGCFALLVMLPSLIRQWGRFTEKDG